MEENKNINEFDNLFKEAFNKAEVTPPADAWSSIQSQIGSAGAGAAGTGGGFMSSLTSLKGIIIAAAVVTGIVTTVVLTSDKEAAKADKPTTENTVADNKEITTPDITTNNNTGNDDVELNTDNTSTNTTNSPNNSGRRAENLTSNHDAQPNENTSSNNGVDNPSLDGDILPPNVIKDNERIRPFHVTLNLIALNDAKVCAGKTAVVFNSEASSVNCYLHDFKWNFGDDSDEALGKNVLHVFEKPGKYTVKLSAVGTGFGISQNYYEEKVIIVSGPEAAFETEDLGEGKFKFTNTSTNMAGATFKWNFGDDSENEGVKNPEHQYYSENATNYKVSLIVTDPVGCADTFEKRIVNRYLIKKEPPTAPNVFTPSNGTVLSSNGINDDFTVDIEGEDYYNLVIYSAKNEVVFRSTDKENKWNGKDLSGNLCAAGSYYYILKYSYQGDDEVRQKSGTVTIIR